MDNNKKKNILLGILIVGIISMTVAFAALSTNLSINGSAGIPTTKWDIHFANGTDNTSSTHANGKVNKGKIEDVNFQATSITGFTVTLYQPNDEVVYNFDIVNAGTIDAELNDFQRSITCASGSELCDEVMTYSITCEDESHNNALADGYILEKNTSVACEMNVKFRDVDNLSKSKSSKVQASVVNGVYTQGALSATIRADWGWVQLSGSNSQSGGNEQGGQGSASCELTGSYAYDFVGANAATDGGDCEFSNTLSPEATIYLKHNNSTGVNEICEVLSGGTVCMASGDYSNDIGYKTVNPVSVETPGYDSEYDYYYCDNSDGYYNESSNKCEICPNGYYYDDQQEYDKSCYSTDQYEVKGGYLAQKKAEYEALGATCQVHDGRLNCSACSISTSGDISCSDSSNDGAWNMVDGIPSGHEE